MWTPRFFKAFKCRLVHLEIFFFICLTLFCWEPSLPNRQVYANNAFPKAEDSVLLLKCMEKKKLLCCVFWDRNYFQPFVSRAQLRGTSWHMWSSNTMTHWHTRSLEGPKQKVKWINNKAAGFNVKFPREEFSEQQGENTRGGQEVALPLITWGSMSKVSLTGSMVPLL